MNNEPQRWPEWLAALGIAWVAVSLILLSAGFLAKILRNLGMIAIERLMGMILIAIAIQMLMEGMALFIKSLYRILNRSLYRILNRSL